MIRYYLMIILWSVCLVSEAAVPEPLPEKPTAPIYAEGIVNLSVTSDKPQFVIPLKSNPSTGYTWFLREYDGQLIIPIKHVYERQKTNKVGEPGVERWTFRVKPAGFVVPQQTALRFVYIRPWEANDQAKQVVIKVTLTK